MISITANAEVRGMDVPGVEGKFFKAENEKAKGKTVVILPGGGYSHHAMDHEGYDWVPFFNDLGVNVVVLKYTLPDGNPNLPLDDVRNTFKVLNDSASVWNVNPKDIGVMGSSAGGHLASTYSTHEKGDYKPAFQILFYPVISFQSDITHPGSRNNFLGENQTDELVTLYSNELQVDADTPPAILFHSDGDGLVVPANSINYYTALHNAGVPAALYIYPGGEHGWGFRDSFPQHKLVLEELADFIGNR